MPIANEQLWKEFEDANKDAYGKCCVDIAREVMSLLDFVEDFDPHSLISQAEKNVGESGITGFMAGAIAHMVFVCHSRGHEFKEKWNKQYSPDPRDGVINPAIITI